MLMICGYGYFQNETLNFKCS